MSDETKILNKVLSRKMLSILNISKPVNLDDAFVYVDNFDSYDPPLDSYNPPPNGAYDFIAEKTREDIFKMKNIYTYTHFGDTYLYNSNPLEESSITYRFTTKYPIKTAYMFLRGWNNNYIKIFLSKDGSNYNLFKEVGDYGYYFNHEYNITDFIYMDKEYYIRVDFAGEKNKWSNIYLLGTVAFLSMVHN